MMGAFGKFLEVSLPARDVLRSLNFYRALGFAELTTGDMRTWHYAVVTDGRVAIGLHGGGLDEPALAFIRPNLARQVRALEESGLAFEFARLGPEEFHEAALRTPDGQLILMVEARTFSPGTDGGGPDMALGRCAEVSLACADVETTRAFFQQAGFLGEAPDEPVRLTTPGLTLGLRPGGATTATLRFAAPDPHRALRRLATLDIPARRTAEGHVITAPEGTRLLLAG